MQGKEEGKQAKGVEGRTGRQSLSGWSRCDENERRTMASVSFGDGEEQWRSEATWKGRGETVNLAGGKR